jgi:uncharacterized membrane protein
METLLNVTLCLYVITISNINIYINRRKLFAWLTEIIITNQLRPAAKHSAETEGTPKRECYDVA